MPQQAQQTRHIVECCYNVGPTMFKTGIGLISCVWGDITIRGSQISELCPTLSVMTASNDTDVFLA